ncbi:hypothetical protein WR25_27226 [Diploscapter pachys]|uniref:Uncharacterized protein n=1 Tax=Diploscapter pachys TaxID=2018661 RepID=A0A2A2JS80_9BILA|nr:hypothetical protein WR25_27226 [Diploscapter pachys]
MYLQELSLLNPGEAIYIELGNSTEQLLPVAILSKAAIHNIAEGRGINEQFCGVSNDKFESCKYGIKPMRFDYDNDLKQRSFVIKRHFEKNEMTKYKESHGNRYTDGSDVFDGLSSRLLAFHNANSDDLRLLNVLLYRIYVSK